MSKNKLCCRVFPIIVLVVSTILAAAIWYFEEDTKSFAFLFDKGELFNYLGTVLFISLVPIGLFYYLNDKEKYQDKARQIALLGFIPSLIVLFVVVT